MTDILRSRLSREVDLLYDKKQEEEITNELYKESIDVYKQNLKNKKTSDTLIILSFDEKYGVNYVMQKIARGITQLHKGKIY
jgi:hypothetical protein